MPTLIDNSQTTAQRANWSFRRRHDEGHYGSHDLVSGNEAGWGSGCDERTSWRVFLNRYLAGWAEPNPLKIIQATGPGYLLNDPLVGLFTRKSLPRYFKLLQARFAIAGATRQGDFAFFLRGPTNGPSSRFHQQFWREAPRIGLTGITEITIGHRGVIAESVAYDLNLASDVLRRALS